MGTIVGLSMVLSSIMVVTSLGFRTSIGRLHLPPPSLLGFSSWCWSSKLLPSVRVSFSTTTLVLFICLPTLCFISSPSTSIFITTLSGNRLFKRSLIIRHVRALEQMADIFANTVGDSHFLSQQMCLPFFKLMALFTVSHVSTLSLRMAPLGIVTTTLLRRNLPYCPKPIYPSSSRNMPSTPLSISITAPSPMSSSTSPHLNVSTDLWVSLLSLPLPLHHHQAGVSIISLHLHRPICTPTKPSSRLIQDGDLLADPQLYHNIVGVTITHPELVYVVNWVCKFMHCPTKTHWRTIKRILGYLKGYLTSGLVIRPCSDSRLVAYSDVGHLMGTIVGLSMVLSSIMVVTSVVGLLADWCWSSNLLSSVRVSFFAITLVLFICRPTLCFISSPSTSKLITTLSRNRLFKRSLIIRHVCALEQMVDIFANAIGNNRFLSQRDKLHVISP
ncbi:LOW QUALITY PROTEIN: hypothetical protein V2J09_000146 [Rumex salicifolius]